MAEAWASHILNHLLCFLWWIKNEYLDKTINWKSAKKQFLIQEYLRLLHSFTGLGEFGSLYQDYTLTSLFFCIQNLMLPYPGLSGSAFDYQDQWTGEKKSCGETRQIQNEMRLQSLLQFPLVFWFPAGFFWQRQIYCLSFGTVFQTGRRSGTGDHSVRKCTSHSIFIKQKDFSIAFECPLSCHDGFARWNAFCSVLMLFTRILEAAKYMFLSV